MLVYMDKNTERSKQDEKITEKITLLREHGCKEPFKVVPTAMIRCLAPCPAGSCVCSPDFFDDLMYYTIVDEDGLKKGQSIFNEHMGFVNKRVQKLGEDIKWVKR